MHLAHSEKVSPQAMSQLLLPAIGIEEPEKRENPFCFERNMSKVYQQTKLAPCCVSLFLLVEFVSGLWEVVEADPS